MSRQSAVELLNEFYSTAPEVTIDICGWRNNDDTYIGQSYENRTLVFHSVLMMREHMELDTHEGSELYQTLTQAATQYDQAVDAKYKTLIVEKRVQMDQQLVRQMILLHLQRMLPHFMQRRDCYVAIEFHNTITQLQLTGGSRPRFGKCLHNSTMCCIAEKSDRMFWRACGLLGCCVLGLFCAAKQNFTPKNANVIYYNVNINETYWTDKLNQELSTEQFKHIHL